MNNKLLYPCIYMHRHILFCPFGPIFLWWMSNQWKQHIHWKGPSTFWEED